MRRLRILAVSSAVILSGLLQLPLGEDGSASGAEVETAASSAQDELTWPAIQKLISDQRFEAADKAAQMRLERAREAGDEDEWARALITSVQLRIGLHGYETSVRFLRAEEWPKGRLARAKLNLFYARALVTYYQSYSWEINQRQKVASKAEVDLKAWTRHEIYGEAQRAYQEVWSDRKLLGRHPLDDWAAYLEPGSYPPRIRGTLRDAVAYLFVELLADSSLWRPEQSNEIYRLDLEALLHQRSRFSRAPGLEEPELHPVEAIARVLDDLEAWHQKVGRREAAFEARLERLRHLHRSFTDLRDRELIRSDLESRLSSMREFEWWAVGVAAHAEFVREQGEPWSLGRSREIAQAGWKAYPDSIGGQRCLSIVQTIEAPGYQLSAMSSDGLSRRSIQVSHKNLPKLYFRAYAVDLEAQIKSAKDYNLLPAYLEIPEILKHSEPEVEWNVQLPETPDFRTHRTFVTPPIERPGLYTVIASARPVFTQTENLLQAVNVVFSDLVLVTRQLEGGIEVTVYSGRDGKLLPDTEVLLYKYDWKKGHHRVGGRRTRADGTAHFPWREERGNSQYLLLARRDQEVALWSSWLNFWKARPLPRVSGSLIYTDRSIYRPLQTIHWKVLSYRGDRDSGSFKVSSGANITVSLVDTNNQTVTSNVTSTNEFGSASGEFFIPAGRLLGSWRIVSSDGTSTPVRVEEYKRPTFEVALREADSPLRLNRPAKLTGDAKYYFGLPVVNGTVSWRVVREPVYPWWWHGWGWPPTGSQSQSIATGASQLEKDGSFRLSFTPEADERTSGSRAISYRYTVTAEVTDEGGETRSAFRSFRLGWYSVEASIVKQSGFFRHGNPIRLKLTRTDLNGAPRSGEGTWHLVELRQAETVLLPADQAVPDVLAGEESGFRTPGDTLRPRWNPRYSPEATLHAWPDGVEKARGTLLHDEGGEATWNAPEDLPAGAYRLHYETVDDFGAKFDTFDEFLVVRANATSLALPAVLLAEKSSVRVGETARFLVHSGLEGQAMVLELHRGGKRVERRELHANGKVSLIEVPIGAEDRGGFAVTLAVLRDHQFMSFSQNLFVPWDDRELRVEFSTFRDRMQPGSRETWRVHVKGPSGANLEGGAAELLAYMYDRSLDIFAPHTPPSPLALYPNWTGVVQARTNLSEVHPAWSRGQLASIVGYPQLTPSRLKLYGGYALGGLGRRQLGRAYAEEKSAFRSRRAGALGDAFEADSQEAKGRAAALNAPAPASVAEAPPLRSDFSETAFWKPHLRTGSDGAASIEFEIPDSVTSWNVWVHAVTRDLRGGSLTNRVETVKDLMVRPYLPRFLREGDRAEIQVVVNNASENAIEGELDFEILDPDTNDSLLQEFGLSRERASERQFSVEAGGGTSLRFPIRVPSRVGHVAFTVTASAGDRGDGELRALPVLPGRVHLAQSRFVTLKDRDRRVLHFEDLATQDDPTRVNDSMAVTIDAQLFYGVLEALPYLVNYPYECTEQTLNRFLSAGITSSLYGKYPSVARMAKKLSKRETQLESWASLDANRKMALEEMPWLDLAKGNESPQRLINVLDPRISKAERDAALAKLRQVQTSLGAFPWFPGGPPSPYMTLYLLHGFSKGLEFDVPVPKDVVVRAWAYMHRHYVDELVDHMVERECCWEFITFLNYVLSNYPDLSWTGGVFSDEDRKRMLEFSFRHWRSHSPYLKAYLALTLQRMARPDDARLVFESVMDSAKTTRDEGTFWAPEERSWLWYNDTIETHAFALRALLELQPADPRKDGLVQWLFLNKKLNHWKSTRATAEVLYALVHYLDREEALGLREEVTVELGSQKTTLVFDPELYTGKKNQILVPGEKIDPKSHSTIVIEKESRGFAFASATWHFSTEKLPDEARGDFFSVTRRYFKRTHDGQEWTLVPLEEGASINTGDEIEVQLSLRLKHSAEYVHLRDPRAAGLEPDQPVSRFKWDLGIGWYEEVRDSATNFFFERLPMGEYTFRYRLRANLAGDFRAGPATLQSMYAPEFTAYSSGSRISIE
jgi:uncharacterized protein YfaS (alpha-2-macroglobulin family)